MENQDSSKAERFKGTFYHIEMTSPLQNCIPDAWFLSCFLNTCAPPPKPPEPLLSRGFAPFGQGALFSLTLECATLQLTTSQI